VLLLSGAAASLYLINEGTVAAGELGPAGLSPDDLREYRSLIASYHRQLPPLLPRLATPERALYESLVASTAWQRLTTVETASADRGTTSAAGGGAMPASQRPSPSAETASTSHPSFAKAMASAQAWRDEAVTVLRQAHGS